MKLNKLLSVKDVGKLVNVYNGKKLVLMRIKEDMVNHYLGEFIITKKQAMHVLKKKGKGRAK